MSRASPQEPRQALSEDSVFGPRASGFSPGKDGEAGDIGFIVDAAGCSQAENKPLEARSSLQTEPNSSRQSRTELYRLHLLPSASPTPAGPLWQCVGI